MYTLTHPYKSPKKILPLCRFFEIWRNSLLLSNCFWFYIFPPYPIFEPLPSKSRRYQRHLSTALLLTKHVIPRKTLSSQVRVKKSRQKMCHFTYVMIKISTFEAEKNLTTDFFPQKCHSWLYSEETDFYKKTVIFWLEKKRS